MKIKLAILEKDSSYLNRIVTAFNAKYSDKLEIYSFTDEKVALGTIESTKIDVLVASDLFDIDAGSLPRHCGFAYFVDTQNIETIKGECAICKFQKADLIYKQILSIYSEKTSSVTGTGMDDSATQVLYFTSVSGGVGGSTMAAACATALALQGKRVLYLNLEQFGDADIFFHGEGQFTFGDVIYAIKSKKTNVCLKLESTVKQDVSGVYFYSAPQVALDIMELEAEDIKRLLNEIRMSASYEYIVVDANFSFEEKSFLLWKEVSKVIVVSDGSEISNKKFERMYSAMEILGQQDEQLRMEKMNLLYNKFSNKMSKTISGISVNNIGGIPKIEMATHEQIIQRVVSMGIMNRVVG